MGSIEVTSTLSIDDRELEERFIRSSGPGGQNVNKVSTAVQLRFDVANSPSLPDDVRERLLVLAGRRMSADGTLVIDARRFRSQERNREDALVRLIDLISRAAAQPRLRKATRPTRAAKRRRLESKRQRGNTKRLRGGVSGED